MGDSTVRAATMQEAKSYVSHSGSHNLNICIA